MKTRTLRIVVFAAVALTAGWSFQQNKQKAGLSDLALENIEALAEGETNDKGCKLHLTSICETSNTDHYLYRNR